jgi:hypothetical protein
LSKLREPLSSNKDNHHGEVVATSGGKGLVDLINPMQGDQSQVLAKAAVEGFSKIL